MLSSLPCNYKSLWSWMLSIERMCQLIRVWIQQSITHQQWQSTNTSRQSSVNRSTAAHPFTVTHTHTHTHTHLSSKYNYPPMNAHKKLDTRGHVHNQTHYDVDTDVHTGASGESPEFCKCLTAHSKRSQNNRWPHDPKETHWSSEVFTKNIQTLPNVSLQSLPGVQNTLS